MRQWYTFIAYTCFIGIVLIGAYIDVIPTEIAIIPMYDSIGHFVLYGIWFYLFHEALGRKIVLMLPLALLILFPVVAFEEFAQLLASTRTFSLVDLLWGFGGMCTFWFISNWYHSVKST